MPDLYIYLLGQFRVELDGEPITRFRSTKSRLLLAYLVSQPGIMHPRGKLATLLWGDVPDKTAKTSLRVALSALKQLLKAHPALEIKRHAVQFHTEWATVDLLSFTNGMADGSVQSIERALAQYRGEFLPAMALDDAPEFDDWRLITQEKLHQQAMSGFDTLQVHYAAQAEWASLLTAAQQQLALTPWHEAAFRSLMQAHAGQGDLHAAQIQHERCRTVLQRELGVEPSAETEALWQRLSSTETQHNLPKALPPFFGRNPELTQIEQALRKQRYRLLTLTGIGGTGKTRLALEIAERQVVANTFADGVWFVPLASAESAEALVPAIASALGIMLESAEAAQLHTQLENKKLLLILDNLEQLPDSATDTIHALLQATRHVTILATSRRRLGLRIETIFPMRGLPDPPALTLFKEHAVRLNPFAPPPNPQLAAEICQLVDGLPLGIELAVAQTEQRDLSEVAAVLRGTLAKLSTTMRDIPSRQRSLRAVFESSWVLLAPVDQTVLTQLSIFRGGAALSDVRTIAPLATMGRIKRLVNHSLLRLEADRVSMHPLVREFSAEKRDPQDATPDAHSAHYLASIEQKSSYPQRRKDLDNVRAAWRWALAQPDLLRLRAWANAFSAFMLAMGYLVEANDLLAQGVAIAAENKDAETQARLLHNQSDAVRRYVSAEKGRLLLQKALALNPSAGLQAELHGYLASELAELGQLQLAYQHHETQVALARQLNSPALLAEALEAYAYTRVLYFAGTYEAEIERLNEALQLVTQHQFDNQRTLLLHSLSVAHLRYGDYATALRYARECLRLSRQQQDRFGQAQDLLDAGLALDFSGYFQQAIEHYAESLTISEEMNDVEGAGLLHANICLARRRMGDLAGARESGAKGIEMLSKLGARRMEGQARNRFSHTLFAIGNYEAAYTAYQAAVTCWQRQENANIYEALAGLAASAGQLGHFDEAQALVERVMTFAQADNLHKVVEPCLMMLNCASALRALGDQAQVETALRLASDWIQTIADRISDPAMRQHYIEQIGQHQQLRAEISRL